MTQFDADQISDEDSPPGELSPRDLRRQLQEAKDAIKERDAQIAEAASLRKENAFLKAGLPDTPVTKLYRDTYANSDLSEEAIKAGAVELGIIPKVDEATQAEMSTLESQSEALVGSTPSMAPNDRESMMKEFAEVVAKGGNGEQVLRKYGHPVASDER